MSNEQPKTLDERIMEEANKTDHLWPELRGTLKAALP